MGHFAPQRPPQSWLSWCACCGWCQPCACCWPPPHRPAPASPPMGFSGALPPGPAPRSSSSSLHPGGAGQRTALVLLAAHLARSEHYAAGDSARRQCQAGRNHAGRPLRRLLHRWGRAGGMLLGLSRGLCREPSGQPVKAPAKGLSRAVSTGPAAIPLGRTTATSPCFPLRSSKGGVATPLKLLMSPGISTIASAASWGQPSSALWCKRSGSLLRWVVK